MKSFVHNDAAAYRWASERLGISFSKPAVGMLVVENGETIGAAIFNNYQAPNNIDITTVGRGAFDIRIVRAIARYCFTHARRMTATTKESNHEAQRALRSLGFKEEGRLREYFGDEDGIVFGLTRTEQRIVRL